MSKMSTILYLSNIIDHSGKDLPTEFKLFSYGANPANKLGYGDFNLQFDKQHAYKIMANNDGEDIIIDYEHGATMEDGQPHPKAGNAKLELKDDGLYAVDVRWTKRAAEYLTNGEYDRMSPTIAMDEDGMCELICVALTNIPALKNTEALMLSRFDLDNNKKDTNMSDTKNDELLAQILKLTGASNPAEALGMLAAQKKNEADYKAKAAKSELDSLISEATRERKLVTEQDKAEALELASAIGTDAFRVYLSKLPSALVGTPTAPKAQQPQPKTEQVGVVKLSKHGQKIVEVLSRLEQATNKNFNKAEFMKKLENTQKTIEESPFFTGYGIKGDK